MPTFTRWGVEMRIYAVVLLLCLTACKGREFRKNLEAVGDFIVTIAEPLKMIFEAFAKTRGGPDPFEGKPAYVGPNIANVGQIYLVDANGNGEIDEGDYVYIDRENDGILDLKTDIKGNVLWEQDPESKDVLRVDPVQVKANEGAEKTKKEDAEKTSVEEGESTKKEDVEKTGVGEGESTKK
jgi:hypothetical protein